LPAKSGSLREMRRPVTTALLLIMLASGFSTGCAQQRAVVWKLDARDRIGGRVPATTGAPEIVREGDGASMCFGGDPDAQFLDVNPIEGWSRFTIEALIKPLANGAAEQRFLHIEDERKARVLLELRLVSPSEWALDSFLFDSPESRLTLLDRSKTHRTDTWHWVALSYDGTTMTHYVDGARELEGPLSFRAMAPGQMSLGVRLNKVSWYQGCIREVRFTPRALAAPQLRKSRAH
jgi:hypothetical protein